ncbi:MAG: diacylglycerol/lipid kinase family protein [Clostridia bacterium]
MEQKYIFIINPNANRGRNREVKVRIDRVCKKRNLDYEIRFTYRRGSATKIVKEYQDKEYIIYAVGGDGLISEVVNGIVGTKNKLGVIPTGSGNDFARTMLEIIPTTQKIDLGKINNRYFLNIACLGMDADSANNVFRMKKVGVPKNWLYTTSVVYTFFHYKAPVIELAINGKRIKDELTMLAICNGRYYGGGYKVAPNATVNDGLLDVYFVGKFNRIKIPKYLIKMRKGKHGETGKFKIFKTSQVEVKSNTKIRFTVDGEMLSGKEFKLTVLDKALTLYRNQDLEGKIIG